MTKDEYRRFHEAIVSAEKAAVHDFDNTQFFYASPYALWPLIGVRMELPSNSEADWLEHNYPGWYDEIGNTMEHWRDDGYSDPANHMLGVDLFINGKIPVYICRVCQMPTIMPTF